uniref:Uncharacterized protein n=1 Tax=Parascaris equorum TaxID=6256 RepID=A0A914S496_PAREQ
MSAAAIWRIELCDVPTHALLQFYSVVELIMCATFQILYMKSGTRQLVMCMCVSLKDMDENRQGATEGACKHIVINEDSGVSSPPLTTSINCHNPTETFIGFSDILKYVHYIIRIVRCFKTTVLSSVADPSYNAMRDQEEIAVRVSREQEREIAELRQQLASAKEEVRKTKRDLGRMTQAYLIKKYDRDPFGVDISSSDLKCASSKFLWISDSLKQIMCLLALLQYSA